jgi:phage protein U
MMMQLGDFPFGIATAAYERLRRRTGWAWAAQDRLGRAPAQQFVGPETVEVELDGVVLPHWSGKPDPLGLLRTAASEGQPLDWVDGDGYYHGLWVVVAIDEDETGFMAHGKPLEVGFRVRLRAYGEDA